MSVLDLDTGVDTLRRPSPAAALRVIEGGIEAGALVTIFGTCTVDYDGRASSRLDSGDRHVMLKPDGAALVHTDEGQQPVNWQPPGCTHEAFVDGDTLVVRSERPTPSELLVVRFTALRQVSAFDVSDPADLSLSGTHDDLRDRLLDDPDLLETGFSPVETERGTSAGTVDVYGEDAEGVPVVVEVKRSRVGPDAVGQLRRYVDAVEREFEAAETVRGVLVAPSVTERALGLLEADGFEFVSLSPEICAGDG